jgi:hypothetical protein
VISRNDTEVVSVNSIATAHPWDGFLTGLENELAMAAAQAMATGKYDGVSSARDLRTLRGRKIPALGWPRSGMATRPG